MSPDPLLAGGVWACDYITSNRTATKAPHTAQDLVAKAPHTQLQIWLLRLHTQLQIWLLRLHTQLKIWLLRLHTQLQIWFLRLHTQLVVIRRVTHLLEDNLEACAIWPLRVKSVSMTTYHLDRMK